MRITEILNSSKPVLSIEVFPPKSYANFESVCHATEEIAKLKPAFISVTYGAGGVNDQYTMEIARRMLAAGVTPLPHLTCLTSDKAQINPAAKVSPAPVVSTHSTPFTAGNIFSKPAVFT